MTVKRGRPRDELILFVSTGFFRDPKIRELTATEKVSWLTVLASHLEQGNGSSELPDHRYGVVSARRLQKLVALGLVDEIEGQFHIHNWDKWNGREAYKRFLNRERVRRHRRRSDGEL